MDKKVIIPTIILGVATLAGVTAYTGNALADSSQKQNMIDELSNKLGVDKSKVTTAFDEIKTQKEAERQANVATQLDKAVTDGVITSEQKQKIVDKEAELKAQMEKQKTDLDQWIKDNNIDVSKLRSYGVGLMGGQAAADEVMAWKCAISIK
jgi:hypothetical protein